MRTIAHGIIYFKDTSVQVRVDELMLHQCSATRSAYQAIHKHELEGNEVVKYVKKNYMNSLNQTYISSAISNAKGINEEHAIFGGKRNWEKLQNGSLSKEEWQRLRNNQLYASGDRDREGNRNIRVDLENNKILINDPSKRGKWLETDLFLPQKFKNPQLDCYDVRIIRRNDKYEVKIGWEIEEIPKIPVLAGAIGIDTNPDGLAVVEVDGNGNILNHFYESSERIQFARKDKRKNDVCEMAKVVVDYALEKQKMIVLEKLKFKTKTGTQSYKKSNRMKHNFIYSQLVEAIIIRASKFGLPTKLVNPGYTSIIGILKYQEMYSLNRHTAAALVIARRGMNIKERQTFSAEKVEYKKKAPRKSNKKQKRIISKYKEKKYGLKVDKKEAKPKKTRQKSKTVGVGVILESGFCQKSNLEGRSQSQFLKSVQSWEWMTKYLRHPRIAEATPPQLVPDPIENFLIGNGIGCKRGRVPREQVLKTGQALCLE